MTIFIILCYVIGFLMYIDRYKKYNVITIRDSLLFLLSPLCVIPIVLMPIFSIFINLDTELFKKEN